MKKIDKIEVENTEVITNMPAQDNIEQELRELTIEDLIRKLNFEENDPETIKLIEKIIKEKK